MRRLLAALLASLLLQVLPAAAAPPVRGLSEPYLAQRGLPLLTIEGLRVYHSPGAAAEARTYGQALAGALAWYRATLGPAGWDGEIVVAVLDAADWREMVALPYPVPHAERRWGLVVMPDSIASFPGFADWDLDATLLNEALTFHEVGHIIAPRLGLMAGNHWVEELIANLFLAAYARAERPDLEPILAGVPPRFANPGPFDQLFDLDSFYAGGGLENYAWFQFRLAALADALVRGRDFAALVEALRQAFPRERAATRLTLRRSLDLLTEAAGSATQPAPTALVGDLAGDGVLPLLEARPCAADGADGGEQALVFLDNRGDRPLRYAPLPRPADAPWGQVGPGEVAEVRVPAGRRIEVEGFGCLAAPGGYARWHPPTP